MSQCEITTVVTVNIQISLTSLPWQSVKLPLLLRWPIQLYLHVYCYKVWNCHFFTVANKMTLTRVLWRSVTLPPLLGSPIQSHLHLKRDRVSNCHRCYRSQYIYTYNCTVTCCDFTTILTVANKITHSPILCHSVTLPLLLRSPIELNSHVYRDTVWHCHYCCGRQ